MMRTFVHVFLSGMVLCLLSCKGEVQPDYEAAKKVCEKCLRNVDEGNIKAVIDECYSSELSSASKQDLENKFSRLRESTGQLVSFVLKDSSASAEIGEEANIRLSYEVKHSNLNTTEVFTVAEQNGQYKITNHAINN